MNPYHTTIPRLLCAALLIICGTACGSAPPGAGAGAAADTGAAASATLLQQIQSASAGKACDGPQDCHTLAIGAKACGGPERYLAWSSKSADGERLRQLAASHTAARQRENARDGAMSTCSMLLDPGATCRAGQCVLLPPAIGGSAAQ
ncbi:hypothetical protein HSX11_11065 [Oxalobacteraceae bacterium]|nr:hypothetical protein [Oxalobacteraceae bacterium]